ncbi:MAG: glycosyltransferase [Syntrophus sp. (in: bacteria)]|nr:glycosyltransferase [Syntrophus sp. (in: bacteria)]
MLERLKFSIITPNKNSGRFLDETIRSVVSQKESGVDLEYIVIDGGSTDDSLKIIRRYEQDISQIISEPDRGPVSAINKGLRLASGEIVAWLNADDRYHPGALKRVAQLMTTHPGKALCFGACRIIDEEGREIRRGITRFKEAFFPFSSRFTIQCLNYISQPAMFFRCSALDAAGYLREDMVAAWDYDLTLRLWRQGGAVHVPGDPLADFRWHPGSISARRFTIQFQEEFNAAARDAGNLAPQTWIHRIVRWGIVSAYMLMAASRGKGRPR